MAMSNKKKLKSNQKKIGAIRSYEKIGIIFSTMMLLFLLCFGGGVNHYYNNFIAYENLNEIRDEVNLAQYSKNNYLVRDKTLSNMNDEIENEVATFLEMYDNEMAKEDSIKNKIESVVEEEMNNIEKYENVKEVVHDDLVEQDLEKVEEIKEVDVEQDSLNSDEKEKYDEIKYNILELSEENNNIETMEVDALYSTYNKLDTIEEEVNTLNDDVTQRQEEERIKEEQEKAAKIQEEEEAKKEKEEQEKAAQTLDFSSLESDLGTEGSFDRGLGEDLFNATNAYRTHLGLPSYLYNDSMQTCVDSEAQAYGTNGNPHNWLCSVSNENASIAAIGSDAVQIAMDFFMTDPPHEAVLSGNYSSATTAVYESNGMYYMILCVF